MSLRGDARAAAKSIFSQVARSVLREASAQSLEQILSRRVLRKIDEDNLEPGADGKALKQEIEIGNNDIELAYKVATQIGLKWTEKLKQAGEIDSVISLSLVLQNGRFLEDDFNDNVSVFVSSEEHSSLYSSRNRDFTYPDNHKLSPKSNNEAVPQTPNDVTPSHTITLDRNNVSEPPREHCNIPLSSWPVYKLNQLGWDDPLNFDYWITSKSTQDLNNTLSDQWQPLPALNDDSKVHIPQYTCLSLQQQSSRQVYGIPAPTLLKPTKTPSDKMCESSMIIREENPEMRKVFVQDQIKRLDELGVSGATLWYPYDYEVILKAAELNKDRMFLKNISGKKRKMCDLGFDYEIVPKSMIQDSNLMQDDVDSDHDDLDVNNAIHSSQTQINKSDQRDFSSMVVVPVKEYLPKRYQRIIAKKRRREDIQQKSENTSTVRNRDGINIRVLSRKAVTPPESISRQDVLNCLPIEEREQLEKTMIHDDSIEKRSHQILGSLKIVGSNHLWEQLRFGEWNGPQESVLSNTIDDDSDSSENDSARLKIRKRAHRRALKQRLGNQFEVDTKDKQTSKLRSKILWASSKIGTKADAQLDDDQNYYMQLDLGECIFNMILPSAEKIGDSQIKTIAFRSLEVSLQYE